LSRPVADPRILAALDRDRGPLREALERSGLELKSLQAVDQRYALRYFAIVWGAMAAIAWTWQTTGWMGRFLLLPCMGIVQHAMLNLTHEASHYLIWADRRSNDLITNLFASLPICHTVASYRMTHVDHHRYLRSVNDPSGYVTGPGLSRADIRHTLLALLAGRLVWELAARSLLGRRLAAQAAGEADEMKATDRRRLILVAVYQLAAGGVAYATGCVDLWIAWLVVVMTITPTLEGIRSMVEHRFPDDVELRQHTRSHHRNIVVSGLLAPFFQYHWEHHLFPTIPHHQLAHVHEVALRAGLPGARPVEGGFLGAVARLA